MRAEIKGIYCADLKHLETWCPSRPEDVYVALELNIGIAGVDGSDLWQVVVATPPAIRGRPDRSVLFGRPVELRILTAGEGFRRHRA